jgi:hypothetical protein
MEMIGNQIKKIDFFPVEIVIIRRNDLYYGMLIDYKQNMILLEDFIDLIDNRLRNYINNNKVNIEVENIQDEAINNYIDRLIMDSDRRLNKEKESSIIHLLKSTTRKAEIEGIVLFSNRGKIIYSSLALNNLKTLLDKLDFRIKVTSDSNSNSIVNLFYSTKKELIFSTPINQSYFVGVVFSIDTPLGIAEYKLKTIVKEILKILEA